MGDNDIARVYAASLFETVERSGKISEIEEELLFLADIFSAEITFKDFLLNPGVSVEKKKGVIERVFKGKLSDQIVTFFQLLVDKNRQSYLVDIHQSFVYLLDAVNGRLHVTVVSSVKLEDALKQSIVHDLAKKSGKEILLDEKVDPRILGGIIIKYGDYVIDGSLSKDLKNIRTNLITTTVRSEAVYED